MDKVEGHELGVKEDDGWMFAIIEKEGSVSHK